MRVLLLVALCALARAQNTDALQQTFHAPKADVEQALKDMNAYQSGRLPFVEGFVGSIDTPLSSFQRPSYQYSIRVTQTSDTDVTVGVNAKISVWYEDKDPNASGYRDLPSNGRLESDLLERLRARLRQHAADLTASRTPLVSPKLMGSEPIPVAKAGTSSDAPSAAALPNFRTFAAPAKPAATAPEADPHYQRLLQEEKSLKDVLAAQQHPSDLVAVKAAHTAIVASPSETARVLMYADAEDEFQLLKTDGAWTHVQISGLNRGWIRTAQIDHMGDVQASAPSTAPFRETKQETATFPGDWGALRGKNVKIIWVQPNGKSTQEARLSYAKQVFRTEKASLTTGVDGVVIVFDAAEGGMVAATVTALQQWGSGALNDEGFLKQCWFDPADAFGSPGR